MVSGNDAAHTLAVRAAGSQARFVAQMNRHAAALGLADTHYANPVGLDQPGNYSSAADLDALTAKLASASAPPPRLRGPDENGTARYARSGRYRATGSAARRRPVSNPWTTARSAEGSSPPR